MRFPKEMNAQSEFGLSNLKRGLAVFSHIPYSASIAGGCCVLPVMWGDIGAARVVMPRAWRPAEMSQSADLRDVAAYFIMIDVRL